MRRLRAIRPGRPRVAWILLSPGSVVMLLGLALLVAAGSFGPARWVRARASSREEAWFSRGMPVAERLVRAMASAGLSPQVPDGKMRTRAMEILAAHPLNMAAVDVLDGSVWIREGDYFPRAISSRETEHYRIMALQAARSGLSFWTPENQKGPEQGEGVLVFSMVPPTSLVAIKRWRPGAPEVDRFLSDMFMGWMPIRFGIIPRSSLGAAPTGHRDPGNHTYQITSIGPGEPFRICVQEMHRFTPWLPVVAMPLEVEADHARSMRSDWIQAWSFFGLGSLLALGLVVTIQMALQRRAFDAQRLAAMAHGLKTPLALLKLRCDSARNGTLSPDQREAHLIRINDGADQLLALIDNGLEAFRPRFGKLPPERIGAAFFRALEEDLRPALIEEGRVLEMRLDGLPFKAHAGPLRAALALMLENAFIHGKGQIVMGCRSRGRRTEIAVSDEGEGIPEDRLGQILARGGRRMAVPDSPCMDHGLGLHLLLSIAHREAWGLEFQFGPGFTVVIEVSA